MIMRRPSYGRRLAAIVSSLASILLTNSPVEAEESSFVRIQHDRPDGAIPGERVTLSVQILTDTWLSQAATITVPEVPGLIILKVSSFGVNGTERVGAVTYTTQAHEYAVFARRSGRFVIPAFRLRFGVAGQPAGKKVMLDLETDSIELVAAMPPGIGEVEGLIASPNLTVVETWDPEPEDELSVGDAIRRSITYRAEGVMGLAFPPTRFDPVDGLGVYPQTPELDDQTQRGDFLGSRTDALTYVFERPGSYVLPGISVVWWDLDEGVLKQAQLPSRKVEVIPGSVEVGAPAERSHETIGFKRIGLLGILILAGLAILLGVGKWTRDLVRLWRARREEQTAFRRFLDSCAQSDSWSAYRSIRDWHSLVMPGRILSCSVGTSGDRSLVEAIQDLEQSALFGNEKWTGKNTAVPVTRWRRSLMAYRSSSPVDGLPPLNP
jgi:hypothetical protein